MPPSAGSTQNTPLPPSVEKAYYRKCIELKRRINEVEESNDAYRLRKVRLNRAILKMRLERAFLLEQLQKRMEYNADDSDRSTSPPPTVRDPFPAAASVRYDSKNPQDKPMRSKRSHRKTSPDTAQNMPSPPHQPSFSGQHIISPPQTTPEHSRAIYPTVMNGTTPTNPSIAAAPPNAGPTPSFGTPGPANQPVSFAAINQPPPSAESISEERRLSHQENGGPEYSRDHVGGGVTGAAVSAGPEVIVDANGERRVQPDTEMGEAHPEGPSGGGGGFTAVNQ
ncbi:hypothetical protein EV356DRAFT_534416 [Viridothelium virens]|uniref:INO80 complex subunit F domain-containing protein n=1 Tax=Viridothelium virens TaxID=1048519 RepID=A0A6A6H3M2_VIRVR|nr:hypothetical protein EV356DRAFT_534416 [Viridothelium virens]